MVPKPFYTRKKIRLGRLIDVRAELGLVYKACVRKELEWQDARAAVAILAAIAQIDQGPGIDARLVEIERRLGALRTNGHGSRHPNGDAPRPAAWQ
jgi:hypothetical protein